MSIPESSLFSEEDVFSQVDADRVIEKYVCGVCWGELSIIYIPGDNMVLVVCPEHGTVCRAGRVTRNTVSIAYENASIRYRQAIKNVSEWACLVPPPGKRITTGENLAMLGF